MEKVLSTVWETNKGPTSNNDYIYILFVGSKQNYNLYATLLHGGNGTDSFDERTVGYLIYNDTVILIQNYTECSTLPYRYFKKKSIKQSDYPAVLELKYPPRIEDPVFDCFHVLNRHLCFLYTTPTIDWSNSYSSPSMPSPPPVTTDED